MRLSVDLVEDWEILEDYAGDKRGFYQILGVDEPVEVRVAVGRVGFIREFKTRADPFCSRILAFCKLREYIRVSRSIRDELFFK